MYKNTLAQILEGSLGYVAWALVCYLTLSNAASANDGALVLGGIVLALLLYIVGFYFTTREQQYVRMDQRKRQLSFLLQALAVLAIRTLTDAGVITILSVALAAQLPFLMSRLNALFGTLILVLVDFLFNVLFWHTADALIWSGLGAAFHFFALIMSQRVIQEQEARDQITALNRELLATQALLEESAKQTERLRISRDLHDGLGHNLTALILKLQYLTHTTDGDTKTRVSEVHQLARLLMSDVRNTVHEMRDDTRIRLREGLQAMVSQVPRLDIQLHMDPNLTVNQVELAETLFRCVQEAITNSLKHGNASQMRIQLGEQDGDITLEIRDNGGCPMDWREGAGLGGMRERIEALSGRLDILTREGFQLSIRIPQLEAL